MKLYVTPESSNIKHNIGESTLDGVLHLGFGKDICSFLNIRELCKLARTSKKFNGLVDNASDFSLDGQKRSDVENVVLRHECYPNVKTVSLSGIDGTIDGKQHWNLSRDIVSGITYARFPQLETLYMGNNKVFVPLVDLPPHPKLSVLVLRGSQTSKKGFCRLNSKLYPDIWSLELGRHLPHAVLLQVRKNMPGIFLR